MRILILGGTGAMGVHLVNLLAFQCEDLVITSRQHIQNRPNVKYLQVNAQDINLLKPILLRNWDVIIDFMVYDTLSFESRVNFLLEATSQYIFLSSCRVYADSKDPIIESSIRLLDSSYDSEFLATDEYSLSKARQEDILKKSNFKNWTIVRPYITYSKNRLQLGVFEKEEWLYRALKGRTIVFSRDLYSKYTTMTYGKDVARAIMKLIGTNEALGCTYHITAKDPISWNEVLDIYLKALKKHVGHEPKILLTDLPDFMNMLPSRFRVMYDRNYNRVFNNSKIEEYIDTNTFTKVNEGLKVCIEDFLKNPQFKEIDWKAEAIKDRKAKEYTSLKEINKFKQKVRYLFYRFFPFSFKY
jgi:nucleoside-diphosphate-sugar epimerase